MNNSSSPAPAFSLFWPILLPSLALAIFLGWQVIAGVRQYANGIRFEEQQKIMAEQASRAENQLRGVIMDVLELGKTDAQAAGIMKKYNVQFNPAPAPGLAPKLDAAISDAPSK